MDGVETTTEPRRLGQTEDGGSGEERDKGAKGNAKAEHGGGGRKDRRSATGMSGEPKKGGHGGKFTWAGDQRLLEAEVHGNWMENGAVDSKDPNYEDPNEEEDS